MSRIDRRAFLGLAGAAATSALAQQSTPIHLGAPPASKPAPAAAQKPAASAHKDSAGPLKDFDFLFFTDTHLQPELNGAIGCDMAFKRMRQIPVEFAIQGGDHVFDALAVPKQKAMSLFDLYDKTQQDLSLKVYHTLGNHDVFGLNPASGVAMTDPLYGKNYFNEHMGQTYQSFDRNGVHFIILDSVGITADRNYEGRVDAGQIAWLANDLKAVPAGRPIIVVTHIPLVTAINSYLPEPKTKPMYNGMTVNNSADILKMFEGHNVIGVLQGHTHINERIDWHGVPYITSGAVCGNWWKGTRLGTPEGFTIVSVRGGRIATRYETYGFKTIAPENT